MRMVDTCDWEGCQLVPVKVVAIRGYGFMARLNEDQMDLCGVHALEVFNFLISKSNEKKLSDLTTRKEKKLD